MVFCHHLLTLQFNFSQAARESTKVRREPNFSEEERLCLLNFVQQHKTKLLGKAGRPGHGDDKVEERKAKYWRLCAETIKAAGGHQRDWRKVRKQWFDLKDKAKRLKSEMGVTGGGPKPSSSGSLQLAMEVVAREALDGIRARTTEVDPLGHASVEMSQVLCKHHFIIERKVPLAQMKKLNHPSRKSLNLDSHMAIVFSFMKESSHTTSIVLVSRHFLSSFNHG
ncbi:hypothetical protein HOLleu_01522 [Holothuria leucospilota]|uniref:Myb/SANT-like DNA-binding domain-containing protein n=1 Tax=Holothuria leucospilota TaxID=206669 RepID=A0A9Q1HJA3_HOLLE|nr:hypothetical protein HOLleu_01522 [Holothuria leucospilota]